MESGKQVKRSKRGEEKEKIGYSSFHRKSCSIALKVGRAIAI